MTISQSIRQVYTLSPAERDSLLKVVRIFIEQAGGADISNYAPGRINAWNGPKADLRYRGSFFQRGDFWCPQLHKVCERIMPGYHACLVTYSGDGKGIGLHGDQAYAAFTARTVNLETLPGASTDWFMGQQYPGMKWTPHEQQRPIARTPERMRQDFGDPLHHFRLEDGAIVEFNCKNPHAAHPGPDRYSINLWKAANSKSAPALAAWNEIVQQHRRSGGGQLIDAGFEPVLPPELCFSERELAQMEAPPIEGLVRSKDYYEGYLSSGKRQAGSLATGRGSETDFVFRQGRTADGKQPQNT